MRFYMTKQLACYADIVGRVESLQAKSLAMIFLNFGQKIVLSFGDIMAEKIMSLAINVVMVLAETRLFLSAHCPY